MKAGKIAVFAVCGLLLSGCAHMIVTPWARENVVKEPPEMTLRLGEEYVECERWNDTWTYGLGKEGSFRVTTTSPHVLECQNSVPSVVSGEKSAEMEFSLACDEITEICCWSDVHWGDAAAKSEMLEVDGTTLHLLSGGYIYQITAQWTSNEDYGGTVSYVVHIMYEE